MISTILLDHDQPAPDGLLALRVLLRVEGRPPATTGRMPLNLCLVLDRSGSMAGTKLAQARKAAQGLVRRLGREDLVSVVAYDDQVAVVAEPGTGAAQENLPELLGRLGPGGTTNLSGGWLRGRELVARNRREGGVNRVLLLTDGLANVGITDPDSLAGLCLQAAGEGVTTTTIGFGEGFDERLLAAMADAGRGSTYYIERDEQAPGVFEEELEGLLSIAAQNLTVRVELGPSARLGAVHHAYPSVPVDGGGVRLEIGDLYAREPRLLLLELVCQAPEGEEVREVARLTLAADVLTDGGAMERQEVALPVRVSAAEGPRVEPEVRRELLLQEGARAREEATARQRRGDHEAAAAALRDAYRRLVTAYAKLREAGMEDAELMQEAADLQRLAEQAEAGPLTRADAKYLQQRAYDLKRAKKAAMLRYTRNE